jgi:hypothetical protein
MKSGATKPAAKKPEPKKAARPKRKSRSNGGSSLDGVKTWLINNVEKMVLGLVGLIAVWVVYSGFKTDGLPPNNSPNDLEQQLSQATSVISETDWTEVRSVRYPEPDRFDEQASKDVEPVRIEDYAMTVPLHPLLQKRQKLRTDPKLLAPRELEVHAGAGPLALADDKEGGSVSSLLSTDDQGVRPLPDNISQRYSQVATASKIEGAFFVSIKGLVPIREQWEAYDEAFIGAAEYAPERDQPIYKLVLLERKDLTAGETEWKPLETQEVLMTASKQWEIQQDEVVADQYLIKNIVMDVPLILGRDMTRFALHSKVETAEAVDAASRQVEQETGTTDTSSESTLLAPEGDQPQSAHENVAEEQTSEGSAIATLKTDIKMFRFFDFTVQPGHRYVYRASLVVEDPNDPADKTKPSMESCAVSVIERRQQADSARFKSHRETPWSEESPVVTVPHGETILAGAAVAAKRNVAGSEPVAKVLAVAWDAERVLEIPLEVEVSRGSLLNAQKKVEVIDPRQRVVYPIDNYSFASNSMVVDIAGGDPLDRRAKLRSPSLLLIMNSNGGLVVHSELEDFDDYQTSVIPPEQTEARQHDETKDEDKKGDESSPGRRNGRSRRNSASEEER